MAKRKKVLSPRNARSWEDLCSLNRDNMGTKHGWIIVSDGGDVTIAEQQRGQPAKAIVKLPRREFNRIVDWYNADQQLRVPR